MGKTTQDAIMATYKYILDNFECKHLTPSIYFDLTRAFGIVNHDLLLKKLEHYGTFVITWWLKLTGKHTPPLTGAYLRIFLKGVFWALLFIIFTNNMSHHLYPVFLTLFAADTVIDFRGNNAVALSNKDRESVTAMIGYCYANGLSLNTVKTWWWHCRWVNQVLIPCSYVKYLDAYILKPFAVT